MSKMQAMLAAPTKQRFEVVAREIPGPVMRLGIYCCLLLALITVVRAQQGRAIQGTITDAQGSRISGARIEFRSATRTHVTTTDGQGKFVISEVIEEGALIVSYPGFARVSVEVRPDSAGDLQVQLTPAPIVQRITVSANGDARITVAPTSQFSIPRREVEVSGSLTLDEILRQVPGFTLFRRSGSLFANPTSQGVSLRGVGGNGASRAVVLLDGVPLNSPFGGWVYWNRVPRVSVESVEVFNGGTSNLYGSGALGGIVNVASRRARGSFGKVEISYGNEVTPDLSLHAGLAFGKWGISVAGQALRTKGYILVPRDQRGAVDTPAGTGDLTAFVETSRKLGEQGRFFLRGSSFGESRRNGTPVQTNDTRISAIDLGADWIDSTANDFSLRLYGSDELFNQNFSSIAADRNSESLTNRQRNPSQQVGFAGQWRHTFAGKHVLVAGIEVRDVRGHSAETTLNSLGPTANLDAGGRQRTLGAFGEDTIQLGKTSLLTFGARIDTWRNSRGFSNRIPLSAGKPTANTFSERLETAFSPRVSLLHTFNNRSSISASLYSAFRAPTLNELYRSFRVGNIVTNANPALRSERLTGGEAGLSLRRWSERLTFRAVFFWSEIADQIANVTLSIQPTLITRERENLGITRARGVEFSTEFRLPKELHLSAGYVLTDSTVVSFPANTTLVGLRVPQVPKHQVNVQLSYLSRNWTMGLQARFIGKQFDDDQNTLALASFFSLDAEVSHRVLPHGKLFVAVQNLTGVRYAIGRTPVLMLGPPVLGRIGLRIDFPK